MNLNLSKLQEEFLGKHSHLISLSKRHNRARSLGLIIIIFSMIFHFLNFSFFRNFVLGIIMLIVPIFLLLIIYYTGPRNFHSEFDKLKVAYLQRWLNSLENSSLKFIGNSVELDEAEVDEVGFLKQNIHPLFKPKMRNYITGTYKNVNVKIGELDFKHIKNKNALLDASWRPSVLLVFDFQTNFPEDSVSFYVKRSKTYRGLRNRSSPTIHLLKKIVNLEGTKIKSNIKSVDNKYLILSTNKQTEEFLIKNEFRDGLREFNNWSHRIQGVTSRFDAKFLTFHKGKIAILIFRQKFLETRMDSIFEVYQEELNSILQFVDIFKPYHKS